MKLSISVLMEHKNGEWSNIMYKILDSSVVENYQEIKKELIKKLPIKINNKEKRLKRSTILLTFSELKEMCLLIVAETLQTDLDIDSNIRVEMVLNEWHN